MCLDKLKKFKVSATHTDGSIKGWKAFNAVGRRGKRRLQGIYYTRYPILRGWNISKSRTKSSLRYGSDKYRLGYHVFTTKEGLMGWLRIHGDYNSKVTPVYYMPNDILAKG